MSQSIERAAMVMRLVAEAERTPSEVARLLGVNRSTGMRTLHALESERFVRKMPDGGYGLGSDLIALAQTAMDRTDLRSVAHPWLEKLSSERDQTVHLAELQEDRIVYIDKIEPKHSVRLSSKVGDTVRLHTAAVAKSILAFMPDERRNQMFDGYHWGLFTPTTLLDRRELDKQLRVVQRDGFSVDDGEFEDFISCLGAPIRNEKGSVIGAISVTEIKAISDLGDMKEMTLPYLLHSADGISGELGWR